MLSKELIHKHCTELLQSRILGISQSIEDARAASNDDTKSSMGDKYETTREMMSIEIEKLQKQMADTQQMLLSLKVIDPGKPSSVAEPGALISTENIHFFMAAALGKIEMGNEVFMVVSPASPIGRAMFGKKKSDLFTVNGIQYSIQNIV